MMSPPVRNDSMHKSPFQLPGLPSFLSESLVAGTSIPPPPPSPPPTQTSFMTPEKHKPPNVHSVAPPSTIFAIPSMPGTFPSSPASTPTVQPQTQHANERVSYSASAYTDSPSPYSNTTPSRSFKRAASFRALLSFKRSRNTASPYDAPQSGGPFRPDSSGGFSVQSNTSGSLKRRQSSNFWNRRKNTIGEHADDEAGHMGYAGSGHHHTADDSGAQVQQQRAVTSPRAVTETPTVRRRKSSTFWKRKSSLGLNAQAQNEYFSAPAQVDQMETGALSQDANGWASPPTTQEVDLRPRSPPPTLPEVDVQGDHGFLGAEDMFKDIGR